MNSNKLHRWLKKQGCTFGTQNGSHLKVYLHGRMAVLPMHGKKEIGPGLLRTIKRQLGLDGRSEAEHEEK